MEVLLPNLEGKERAYLLFALGKALDDCKDYDRAFEMMKSANELMHQISLQMMGGVNPISTNQMRLEQMKAVFKSAGFGNPVPTMDSL
eukprot:2471002-Pyramimonas_sp.AAC.1